MLPPPCATVTNSCADGESPFRKLSYADVRVANGPVIAHQMPYPFAAVTQLARFLLSPRLPRRS